MILFKNSPDPKIASYVIYQSCSHDLLRFKLNIAMLLPGFFLSSLSLHIKQRTYLKKFQYYLSELSVICLNTPFEYCEYILEIGYEEERIVKNYWPGLFCVLMSNGLR